MNGPAENGAAEGGSAGAGSAGSGLAGGRGPAETGPGTTGAVGTAPVRVLTVVGTDHHPFDRLVRAMDEWSRAPAAAPPGLVGVESFVQYGTASPPSYASGSAYLEHQEVEARMDAAGIVVTHGGPSTVVEARRRGIRPIVMPRRSKHGEHVDDHQVRFITRLAEADLVTMVSDPAALAEVLDRALGDPSLVRLTAVDDAGNQAAVDRFGELVANLFPGSSPRSTRRPRR